MVTTGQPEADVCLVATMALGAGLKNLQLAGLMLVAGQCLCM